MTLFQLSLKDCIIGIGFSWFFFFLSFFFSTYSIFHFIVVTSCLVLGWLMRNMRAWQWWRQSFSLVVFKISLFSKCCPRLAVIDSQCFMFGIFCAFKYESLCWSSGLWSSLLFPCISLFFTLFHRQYLEFAFHKQWSVFHISLSISAYYFFKSTLPERH